MAIISPGAVRGGSRIPHRYSDGEVFHRLCLLGLGPWYQRICLLVRRAVAELGAARAPGLEDLFNSCQLDQTSIPKLL